MVDFEYESILTRFAAKSATSDRRWTAPGNGRQDVQCFGGNHQAVSQATTRTGTCLAQQDSRTACGERSRVAGPFACAVGSVSRCHPRRALPLVPAHPQYHGQPRQHQSCEDGIGLDAQKKTLVASEQDETKRSAWREQAHQLPTQDLVVVDETGSRINMTPLYAYAPRGKRAIGKIPRT